VQDRRSPPWLLDIGKEQSGDTLKALRDEIYNGRRKKETFVADVNTKGTEQKEADA